MLAPYLEGSITQLENRARILRGKIPRDLPSQYDTLIERCVHQLNDVLARLRRLRDDPRFLLPAVQAERVRGFRRAVADLDELESVGVAALERNLDGDHQLNGLIERIRREIAYPITPPVVSSLSQQYFCINIKLHLLCVPLSECRFLLHLPDLYHELAHPLARTPDDPILEPYQNALYTAALEARMHFSEETRKESRRKAGDIWEYTFARWVECWWKHWCDELFCDIFATLTVGPAYGWSHIHLAVKRGDNPYSCVPTTHPADDARMRVILISLVNAGFSHEARAIATKWTEFLSTIGAQPEPEYRRCYPDSLLGTISELAREGVTQIGCRPFTNAGDQPVGSFLNNAWSQFWQDPKGYATWEQTAIEQLIGMKDIPAAV